MQHNEHLYTRAMSIIERWLAETSGQPGWADWSAAAARGEWQ